MRRRDLIPWLLDQPRTVSQLARELGIPPRQVAGEIDHLLASLRHLPYEVEIAPARCRKCDFLFDTKHFKRPSRCPRCHSTWIAEPQLHLRSKQPEAPPVGQPSDPDLATTQTAGPDWIEWLDHTADAGFIVRAPDLPTLFARAAEGLFRILTDPEKVTVRQSEDFCLQASDLPGLMIRWLSELNYRHLVQHLLFSRFDVVVESAGEPRLQARAWGERYDPDRHPLHTEVKAVTWHGLEVVQTSQGWQAQVILDL